MKKIMIGILVIIPLVVMLTVGLIGRYVSQKVHIGVESISFDTDNLSINLSDYNAESDGSYIIDLKALLNPLVLPSHATARDNVEWSMEDLYPSAEETGGAVASLVDETSGKVRVTTYCSFYVYASAEQHTAKCYVEITDKEVQSVTLTGVDSVSVGGSALLLAQYSPLNSIVTTGEWTSSNPEVAAVDANGVVTGVSVGTSVISFTTLTENGTKPVTGTKTVRIVAGVTTLGNEFSVHTDTVDLAAIGFDYAGATAVGGTVNDNVFTFAEGSSSATVTSAKGQSFTVTKCGLNEIEIANSDIFAFDEASDEPFVVATDEVPLTLSVRWKSALRNDVPTGAVWNIADEYAEIAAVSAEGVITAKGTGVFVVTVSVGAESAEITLASVKKIAMLRLSDTESSLEVGLALETVFASRRLDATDSSFVANWFDVSILQPADVDYEALEFSVAEADADKAAFSDPEHLNRLVFNPEGITERTTVTITVRARYPKYAGLVSSTICSLTINVLPGVAVYDLADWNEATAANASMDEAVNSNVPAIVLMSDINFVSKSDIEKNLWCSLYGNNHRLCTNNTVTTGEGDTIINVRGSNITVSNVTFTNKDVQGDMSDDDKVGNKINGRSVHVERGTRNAGGGADVDGYVSEATIDTRQTNVVIEYCLIENCSEGTRVYGAQVDYVGVIIRNIGYNGINILTRQHGDDPTRVRYSTIGIHNCAFSNLLLMPVSVQYINYANTDEREAILARDLPPYDEPGKKSRDEAMNTTITQTGFWDIYNWKDLDNSYNLLMGLAQSLGNLPQGVFDLANEMLMKELLSENFNEIIKRTDTAKYVHFGMFAMGATDHSYLDVQLEESDRWKEITTSDMPSIDVIDGVLQTLKLDIYILDDPIHIWCYRNTENSVAYNTELVVNTKLIQRLHS